MAAGGRYPRQRSYFDDGSYTESDIAVQVSPTSEEPYHLPLMVPQFITERILRERLNELGHRVEFGLMLTDFVQKESHVTARLAGPDGRESMVHASYLVGTDGGGSPGEEDAGRGFSRKNTRCACPCG
ncbi:FAD-dependent monooxygenase [Enterobacter hormaechei]|nr:FAD-dependent monooxygenase [Enterobacter hormaechei]